MTEVLHLGCVDLCAAPTFADVLQSILLGPTTCTFSKQTVSLEVPDQNQRSPQFALVYSLQEDKVAGK